MTTKKGGLKPPFQEYETVIAIEILHPIHLLQNWSRTKCFDIRYNGRPRSKGYHFKYYKQLLQDLELPDLRWHDLRATASTTLLVAGFSPKAVSKLMGHSKEILCVDTYGDGRKLAAIKLEKLDSFIESVLPVEPNENKNVNGLCKIIVDDYLPIVV